MTNCWTKWLRPLGAASMSMSLLFAAPVWADDERAEDHVGDAVAALRDRRLDEALALLDRAQGEAKTSVMLAKIERQRAFVLLAWSRADDALAALVRARKLDPSLGVGTRSPSRPLETLFKCAGTLVAESRAAETPVVSDGLGGWACPPKPARPDVGGEAGAGGAATGDAATGAGAGGVVAATGGNGPKASHGETAPRVEPTGGSAAVPVERRATERVGAAGAIEPALGGETGADVGVVADVPAADGSVPTTTWILGGIAVGGGGAGALLGALAQSAATDRDASTDAGGLALGTNIAFGVAGAALVGAVVVWLAD